MQGQANIVQAEFFYTRSRLKSAVRFFDHSGRLTRFAERMQYYQRLRFRLVKKLPEESGLRKKFNAWMIRRLSNKLVDMPVLALHLVRYELEAMLYDERELAVEQVDRSFRLARRNEIPEVLMDVEYSSGAWLFVFKPNDLCANPVEGIAAAM